MNINETLKDGISCLGNKYRFLQSEIKQFLITSPKSRKQAFEIIRQVMQPHGKEGLLPYVTSLAEIERKIRELQPYLRDHVVHAVLSFILGIYIEKKFLFPFHKFSVDRFQWELAGLFHDVAYPLEIADNIGTAYVDNFKKIAKDVLKVSKPTIKFKGVIMGLEKLTNSVNGIDLIQKRLNEWVLDIDAHREYMNINSAKKICHGIISSLAVLNIIDLLYQKYNPERKKIKLIKMGADWNQKYFEEDIVSACTAIYIHNLPSRCFEKTKINRDKAPLAFLLKLSDCLQDWERPSKKNPKGFPSTQFDIIIDGNQLIFVAGNRKDKIKRSIFDSLDTSKIEILDKK